MILATCLALLIACPGWLVVDLNKIEYIPLQKTTISDNVFNDEDEIKELKFEDGLKKLEELVNQLDDGSLSLEESISYYEIGVKLKSHCEKLLKTAELKILKVSDKEKIVTEELQVGDNEQSL